MHVCVCLRVSVCVCVYACGCACVCVCVCVVVLLTSLPFNNNKTKCPWRLTENDFRCTSDVLSVVWKPSKGGK